MKKTWILIVAIVLVIASCKKDGEVSGTLLRIQNVSQYNFESIMVNSPGGMVEYSATASGVNSSYKSIEYTYRYAYIEVMIDGEKFILQPIDYLGEEKYMDGKYTFQLDVYDFNSKQLSIGFVEE